MANTNEDPEVKIIDRVEVAPAGDDAENVEEEKETPIDSSQEKNDEPAEKESEEEDEAESENVELYKLKAMNRKHLKTKRRKSSWIDR